MPRNTLTCSLIVCLTLVFAQSAWAQYGADQRQEYIRSSSPTKRGGRVYSETVGDRQTEYRFEAPPRDRGGDDLNAAARGGANARERGASSEAAPRVAFRQSAADQRPSLGNNNTNNNVNPYGYGYGCVPYPSNRLAQCHCGPVGAPPQQLRFQPGQAGFAPQQVGFGQAGFGFGQPPQGGPAFAQRPQGGLFGGGGFGGGGFAGQGGGGGYPLQAGLGVPQFNQTGGSWWTPFLTGSGYYTPLLNFRNMPPGSYLGQGLIGQPTAYVDGQPFRNLLRYVSP